jgi:segregation and condensation protein A
MLKVLDVINNSDEFIPFSALFTVEEGRMGVVVTFIAILELIRQSVLELVQNEPYAPIYIRSARGNVEHTNKPHIDYDS